MKKNYIFFLLFSWINFYGQTYNFNITSGIQCNICQEEGAPPGGPTYNSFTATNYYYLIKYNNTTIATENTNYVSYTNTVPRYSVVIPNGSLFTVNMTPKGSAHYDFTSGPCNTTDPPKTMSLKDLIINGTIGFQNSRGISANINSFKPNITIQNVGNSNPNEICAGETLTLNATTDSERFPDEAYHWQYSLNGISWTDFPATITNNTPVPIFSMQQLLGALHEYYFNTLIYFRTGYTVRAFSNVLAIKYSSCPPVIKAITYVGPRYSGDKIQKVDVTFNRELTSNESLLSLAMVNVQNDTIRNQTNNIEITDFISPNVYSYTNLENDLESRKTYKFVYQAKINNPADPTKPFVRGTTDSPVSTNFTYNPPSSLKFEITDKKNPSYVEGDDSFAEIAIMSGTAPYHFYINNIAVAATYNSANSKYYISGLKSQTYNLK